MSVTIPSTMMSSKNKREVFDAHGRVAGQSVSIGLAEARGTR